MADYCPQIGCVADLLLAEREAASTKRAIDGGALALIMGEAAARIGEWFRVTESALWGKHDPFDLVDGERMP